MKKILYTIPPSVQSFFAKKAIAIVLFFAILSISITSCYTTQRCPAYGHYSQVEIKNYE